MLGTRLLRNFAKTIVKTPQSLGRSSSALHNRKCLLISSNLLTTKCVRTYGFKNNQSEKIVKLSSGLVAANVAFSDADIGNIPEPPSILSDTEFEAVDSVLKNSLSYWGLDTYWPAGLVRQGLDFFHTTSELPWWEVIGISGVMIRLMTVPLFIYNQKEAARTAPFAEGLKKRQQSFSDAARSGDPLQTQIAMMEFQSYQQQHKIQAWRPMIRIVPNAIIFMSFFLGLKKMADAPLESMKTEGTLWFTDLTLGDPYWFALPLLSAISMHFVIRIGAESGQTTEAMKPIMKYAMLYGFPAMIMFASSYFSSALLMYWVASNMTILMMSLVVRLGFVRRLVRLPPIVKKVKKTKKKSADDVSPFRDPVLFAQQSVKSIKNKIKDYSAKKKSVTNADIDKADRDKFVKSGKLPIQPSYPFNPRERMPKKDEKEQRKSFWDFIPFYKRRRSN